MQNLAWIDGSYCDLGEAKVFLEDRGYLFGDGVYEVARVYRGKTFFLGAHLERLQKSAAAIRISLPYSIDELEKIIQELLEKSGLGDGYIYIQLTRGRAKRDHLFPEQARPVLTMYVRELPEPVALEKLVPARCITLPDERWLKCHIKSVNLLPNLLARQQAAEAGAQEAILYRSEKNVTEGTRSNVFAIIDDEVRTHPESNLILSGITRAIILSLCADLSLPVSEKAFTLSELQKAGEVWITSTTMEVNPVSAIDGNVVGSGTPGPFCCRIMEAFRAKIAEHCY